MHLVIIASVYILHEIEHATTVSLQNKLNISIPCTLFFFTSEYVNEDSFSIWFRILCSPSSQFLFISEYISSDGSASALFWTLLDCSLHEKTPKHVSSLKYYITFNELYYYIKHKTTKQVNSFEKHKTS